MYRKDLGERTDVLAKAMRGYSHNSSWEKAEDLLRGTTGQGSAWPAPCAPRRASERVQLQAKQASGAPFEKRPRFDTLE